MIRKLLTVTLLCLPLLPASQEAFSLSVFRELAARNPGKNVVFSPAGAESIVHRLQSGTAGKTRGELNTLVCGKKSPAAEKYSSFAVFADEALPLRPTLSTAQRVPLVRDRAAATKDINTWAKQATNGQIPTLLAAEDLSPNSRLLVCDALYFKAKWQQAFAPELTETYTFTHSDGKESEVDMMNSGDAEFAAAGGKNWRAVALPYNSGTHKLHFVAILPRADAHGFAAHLTADKMNTIRRKLSHPRLTAGVMLPRFRAESELIDISDLLRKHGVQHIFSEQADFSPWTTYKPLKLASIRQKACVEVTEGGTTAASATYADMDEEEAPEKETLLLDRPFLWYIGELTPDSTPLMMGIFEGERIDD